MTSIVYSNALGRGVLYPVARSGYRRFLRTGETPAIAYSAMRKLFGSPDASLFERLRAQAQHEHPPVDVSAAAAGVAEGQVNETVAALERDGFAVLGTVVDDQTCAQLEACARAASCTLVAAGRNGAARAPFDATRPAAIRYDLDEEDILSAPAAQRLMADRSFLAIAARYLGATPVQDLVAMWWSTAVGHAASSAAAQEFHFDLDRLRFLKVFLYLTDVDGRHGPHVFVRGSHRSLPPEFRRDGRYPDTAVQARFGDDVRIVEGPRGTVFLADTRGLHKGLNLAEGHRLVFQLEYATSLFGQRYETPAIAGPVPELVALRREFPATFARFRF